VLQNQLSISLKNIGGIKQENLGIFSKIPAKEKKIKIN
jgi:hypothetical protein